jgi:release factor glutamine methyltransferase
VLGLHKPHELVRVEEFPGEAYTALVEQRAARVPLQHLLGSVGFRWIELQVGPGVFVPRPETEVVVGYAIDALPKDAAPVVVDLCTGSGAIALSVAHEVPGAVVHAVELDPAALEWARRNDPKGSVTWHLGPVEGCLPELDGAVDVVISNPPYVAETERHLPDPEVIDHDPHLALFAGEDGLDVVREVERAARRLLRPGGLLVVEHSDRQGESAPDVLEQAGGWAEVQDHQDLTGRDRYVTARWQR